MEVEVPVPAEADEGGHPDPEGQHLRRVRRHHGTPALMQQQEFSQKEQEHNKFVNQKNVEVKDLIARIITLETQVKVLSKEKEILEHAAKEHESEIGQRDETIANLRRKMDKGLRDWEQQHEDEIRKLKERLTLQSR